MTPADIDALERLLGEATAGEWFVDHDRNLQPNVYAGDRDHWVALLPHQCLASLEVQANTNARAIAALHNAAPALLALARDGLAMRALREECAGCEDEGAQLRRDGVTVLDATEPDPRDAEIAALRARNDAWRDSHALLAERYDMLRAAIREMLSGLGNGACIASDASDELHALGCREAAAVVRELRAELDRPRGVIHATGGTDACGKRSGC